MNTKRTRILGSIATFVTAALLTLGMAAPAQAYNEPDISNTVTPGINSVTVDLATVNYGGAPTGAWIDVLSGGICSDGDYCYSTVEQEIKLTSNYNGIYTIKGLKANTKYEVWLYAYGDLPTWTFKGYTKTLVDPKAAPAKAPSVHVAKNGVTTTVKIPAEHEAKGTKFNIYAHYKGAWHRVKHAAKEKTTYTVSLPRKTNIYLGVTAIRKNGESAKQFTTSNTFRLDWASPTVPSFDNKGITGIIYPDHAVISWHAAKARSGHITKYVLVTLRQDGTVVSKHSYKAGTRHGNVTGLTGGQTYIFVLTAYNSKGKHTTYDRITGVYN